MAECASGLDDLCADHSNYRMDQRRPQRAFKEAEVVLVFSNLWRDKFQEIKCTSQIMIRYKGFVVLRESWMFMLMCSGSGF